MNESELRDALGDHGRGLPSVNFAEIVRRGRRRRAMRRSAAGAGAVATAGVVGVAGLAAVSSSRQPAPVVAGAATASVLTGASPSPSAVISDSPSITASAGPALTASVGPAAVSSSPPPSPPAAPTGAVASFDLPGGHGRMAYTLRHEQTAVGDVGVILNTVDSSGRLKERLDCSAPAVPWTQPVFCTDKDPTTGHWLVYGTLQQGATDVRMVVHQQSLAMSVVAIKGTSVEAFFAEGDGDPKENGIGFTWLDYVDPHGTVKHFSTLHAWGGPGLG